MMSLHTPRGSEDSLTMTIKQPLLRTLATAILAVTSLAEQTGCAALNAARVGVIGSDLDKKILSLDDQANEVKASDLPDSKKQELLARIEWKKTVLNAYDAYLKRDREILNMETEAGKAFYPIPNTVRHAIVEDLRNKLDDPYNAPIKDMLNDEETARLSLLLEELKKAKVTLADKNLVELSNLKIEWSKDLNGREVEESTIQGWINIGPEKQAALENDLKAEQSRLAQRQASGASPQDIWFTEQQITRITKELEKLKADIASWNKMLKWKSAIRTLDNARDTATRRCLSQINWIRYNALGRAGREYSHHTDNKKSQSLQVEADYVLSRLSLRQLYQRNYIPEL